VGTINSLDLKLDICAPIPQFRLFSREDCFIDFVGQTQVEQSILLIDKQCFLAL
jgi:hypothetical protein